MALNRSHAVTFTLGMLVFHINSIDQTVPKVKVIHNNKFIYLILTNILYIYGNYC